MTVILENAGSTVLLEGEAAEKYLKRKAEEKAKAKSEYDNEHYMNRFKNSGDAARNDANPANVLSHMTDLVTKKAAFGVVEKELDNRANTVRKNLDNASSRIDKQKKDIANGKEVDIDEMRKTTDMIKDHKRLEKNYTNVEKNDLAAADAMARHMRKAMK